MGERAILNFSFCLAKGNENMWDISLQHIEYNRKWKVKETNSSVKPPENVHPADTLIVAW